MTRSSDFVRRLEAVTGRRGRALSLFERAHQELIDSAEEADKIAQAAESRRKHFETVTQAADQESATARQTAAKLGDLIGKGQ